MKQDIKDLQISLLKWCNTPDINGLSIVKWCPNRLGLPFRQALLYPDLADRVYDKGRANRPKQCVTSIQNILSFLEVGKLVRLPPVNRKAPREKGSKIGPWSLLIETQGQVLIDAMASSFINCDLCQVPVIYELINSSAMNQTSTDVGPPPKLLDSW